MYPLFTEKQKTTKIELTKKTYFLIMLIIIISSLIGNVCGNILSQLIYQTKTINTIDSVNKINKIMDVIINNKK